MTTKATEKVAKAPEPRGRRKHTKPAVPVEAVESEQVARTMYNALKAPDAPRAHQMGYVMGALAVLKTLIDQADQQGGDRGRLRSVALNFIARI